MAKHRGKIAGFTALFLSSLLAATSLSAAEGYRSDRNHHHIRPNPGIVGGDGLPSVVPGIGTYAGSIRAVRVPGSGIYFATDGASAKPVPRHRAPKATIIEVDFESADAACSFEGGVCVIRLSR